MIRKIIIIGIIAIAAYFFYKKFVAPTVVPFFKEETGKVDFLGVTTVDTVDTLLKTKESR